MNFKQYKNYKQQKNINNRRIMSEQFIDQIIFSASAAANSTIIKKSKGPPAFHGTPLIISWLLLGNLAVIVAALRWFKYSFYLHVLLGLAIIGLTLGANIDLLVKSWLGTSTTKVFQKTHNIIGFVVLCYLGVIFISGILARVVQYSPKVSARVCWWTKKIHMFSGYFILLISKFNYLDMKFTKSTLQSSMLLLMADVAFLIIYILIKFMTWTLSEEIIDPQIILKNDGKQKNVIQDLALNVLDSARGLQNQISNKSYDLPKVKKQVIMFKSEAQITLQNYVIFNDYIYDTNPFQQLHPGGQYVMKLVNKREVDRFLYGNYAAQLTPNMSAYNHSKNSMKLCGQPIGKIQRTSPMKGFNGLWKAKSSTITPITQGKSTYLINIQPLNFESQSPISLRYQGFKNEAELGQYFSLTITNKKGRDRCTRLYTTIWCMRSQNLSMMQRLFPGSTKFIFKNDKIVMLDQQLKSNTKPIQSESKIIQSILIPFVIKVYSKGELTPRLFGPQFQGELILSEPMGAGMHYQRLKQKGKVIIVCGGTGILPFCDFFDILFKRVKYIEGGNFASQMIRTDYLVSSDIIKNRQFVIYFSAQSYLQIPALVYFQINYLCSSTKINFKAHFRLNSDSQVFSKQFPKVLLQKQYFNSNIQKHIGEDICQLYICGSPSMNSSLAKLMIDKDVNSNLYHFM